ncbi:hypothetical protein Ct9H90mP29_21600 [bacterium]|nr:MAG: hypothetical protein Ct9H90mP29_21600 [bacterium]
MANITLFGIVAMLLYPIIANFLFATDSISVGIFLGASIHETAQVVGAGMMILNNILKQRFGSINADKAC